MKRTTYLLLLATTALLFLALSACVRPAPGAEDLPEATATLPGVLLPTQPLPTTTVPSVPSPTPLPVVPVEASPTPLPVVEPTAVPAVQPTAPATGERIHVVQAGENLATISSRYYGTPAKWKLIFNANQDRLTDANNLRVGTRIVIPPS